MPTKDVHGGQDSHNISIGVGTKLQREKLVERIGALCAAQRKKKSKNRRKK
jgi:hypothetical protein